MEEIEPECYRKRGIAALKRGKATFHLVGIAVETIRRPACVESRWRLGGSSSPEFGDPGNQPLASVSTQLLHVYFDSVFSMGVGPGS